MQTAKATPSFTVSWHRVNSYNVERSLRGEGIGGRFALVLLGFAAALGGSEAVLRIAEVGSPDGLRGLHEARPDRPWLYGLRPGARGRLEASDSIEYRINEEGFRDQRYATFGADPTQILVFGDSLTFGYGVAAAQTYPAMMEAALAGAAEVLNMGVGGYNPYNEAALFDDLADVYAPDLVLVQFCTNDLLDPTLHFDAQTRIHLGTIPDAAFPDPAMRQSRSAPRLGAVLGLCRSLRVCALADDAWLRTFAAENDLATRLTALRSPDAIPDGPQREWLAAHYLAMANRAAALGAGFAVVVFPFEAQLEGSASNRLQSQLIALGEERGWQTLDLLPAFEAAKAGGSDPLFIDQWHPSAAGHRTAAFAILDGLRRLSLLPGALHE